jgi:hypothetical protein
MIRPFPCAVLCVTLGALTACDEDALRPRPSSSAHAAVTATPTVSSSTSAAPVAPSNSPFSLVARSPDAFELYPLKGALFLDAAGFLAVLGDGPLRQSPAIMKGLEKGQSGRILGGYPDAAWIVAADGAFRWTADRWVESPLLREHETLLDLTAWGDKSAVAAIAAPGNDMRFALAGGKPGAVPAPVPAERTETDDAACKVRMKPAGVYLAGLPSGELYAAGYACEAEGRGGAIVERWEAKQVRGVVEALPKPESGHEPTLHGVLARAPGEVIVYGTEGAPPAPYLARFDGRGWSLDKAPFGGGVDTLASADDGTLWAAAGGAAWKKPAAGAWEKVPLPGDLHVQVVWPRTATDVWAAAREREGKNRAMLLRTLVSEGKDTLRLPPRNAMSGTIATSKHFFATAACDKVFASLYALGPSKDPATGKPTEVPKDFSALKPLFEGELAGLQPIVEDDGTQLYVGAVAPSRELGRKLVAAYQERSADHEGSSHAQSPGVLPSVFCHEPVVVKQVIKLGAAPPSPRSGPIKRP